MSDPIEAEQIAWDLLQAARRLEACQASSLYRSDTSVMEYVKEAWGCLQAVIARTP